MTLSLNLYQTMALAVGVYYLGAFLKSRIQAFRTYCIPVPVIGGVLFAVLNLIFHQTNLLDLHIDTVLQPVFMNVFFTSIGFTASFAMLKKGGKSLLIFLIVVTLLVFLQNLFGAFLCREFGLHPLLGLALGSIPLTGGHGTSTAFGPMLEQMGVANAMTVAVAAATYGLVAGNVFGNPMMRRRIKKLKLSGEGAAAVDHEALLELEKNTVNNSRLDVERGTLALALLFLANGVGTLITALFSMFNIGMAVYVGSMIVGIIIRNYCDRRNFELPIQEIETIGSISLNFFLVLAMLGIQLHQLADLAGPMVAILLLQTLMAGLFVYFITFNVMGHDYDAAVLSSGHFGFCMGATPNAMANMDALSKAYGPSDKAYLLVPICGGFFIDIVNALILTLFMNIL